MTDIQAIEDDNKERMREVADLRATIKTLESRTPDEADFKSDEKLVKHYTGLSSFSALMAIFNVVSAAISHHSAMKLTNFKCFTLTMMRLRLDLPYFDLGYRFGVSDTTASRIFTKWIGVMTKRLSFLIVWPDRDSLRKTMPFCFQCHYGQKVISVIDCFEIFVEKPSNLLAKSVTWSQYKHYNTAKYLISITPQGVISYISNGWGGRASDKYIIESSGYLSNLLPGDVVLADRGFNVAESVALHGATLYIPAFTRGVSQLDPLQVEATRKLANVRIHVERVIGSMRQRFKILNATSVVQKELYTLKCNDVTLLDCIVRVCCALNNVCDPIVPIS